MRATASGCDYRRCHGESGYVTVKPRGGLVPSQGFPSRFEGVRLGEMLAFS